MLSSKLIMCGLQHAYVERLSFCQFDLKVYGREMMGTDFFHGIFENPVVSTIVSGIIGLMSKQFLKRKGTGYVNTDEHSKRDFP